MELTLDISAHLKKFGKFLELNKGIEKFELNSDPKRSIEQAKAFEIIIAVVALGLKNMNNLKIIMFNKLPEIVDEVSIREIGLLISQHAKSAVTLRTTSLEYIRREDSKVLVRSKSSEDRWRFIEWIDENYRCTKDSINNKMSKITRSNLIACRLDCLYYPIV